MKTTTTILLLSLLTTMTALSANAAEPLEVNAADLIEKVYCVADPSSSHADCREAAGTRFAAAPVAEEDAEWMSATEGFRISYDGMEPEAEAMARYSNGAVAGYGYIFYFPYEVSARETANCEQCRFCTALLQELSDMGIALGADPMTDALFDVCGAFKGGDLQLTLREDIENETITPDLQAGAIPSDREGQFIVLLSVVPANTLDYTAQLAE